MDRGASDAEIDRLQRDLARELELNLGHGWYPTTHGPMREVLELKENNKFLHIDLSISGTRTNRCWS